MTFIVLTFRSLPPVQSNMTTPTPFPLQTLPSVLKRRVTSFLDYRTAIALSRTSKKFHTDLNLVPLGPPFELIDSTMALGEVMTGDVPVKSLQIPIFYQNPHTVCLRCRWKDQGWGNRKVKDEVKAKFEFSQTCR